MLILIFHLLLLIIKKFDLVDNYFKCQRILQLKLKI